jgi:hypothetical protein
MPSRIITAVLLFVIDDWVIIADYVSALRGRILRGHTWRIWGANFVLVGLAGWGLIRHYPWYVSTAGGLIMLSLLLLAFPWEDVSVQPSPSKQTAEPPTTSGEHAS